MPCDPRHRTIPAPRRDLTPQEALEAARAFAETMATRRSIRHFAPHPIDRELIRLAVAAAASAPSGANVQPWRFVVVTDPELKRRIRAGAEKEERDFYDTRAPSAWLEALAPLGTDWRKPHLEDAPCLIVVFEVHKSEDEPKPYYAKESVGIAVGFLLAALHHAGLATLSHTPSPMRFLNEILGRPANERAFAVIPVGLAAEDAEVPDIPRKPLEEILIWLEPR